MIDILKSRLDPAKSRDENIHIVREFLQLILLRILSEAKYFQGISFVGGTSLRFLYQLQRFSEDLDFSVTQKESYDFTKIIDTIKIHLEKLGFHFDLKVNEQKIVQSVYVKFISILQELELSPLKDEKLSIRIEIDTNPPGGWKNEMSILNNVFIFPIWHFDLPSLCATKVHACLFRKFHKGRDFYDLVWYLSKKVQPNYELLNNAILQTENVNLNLDSGNLKNFLLDKIVEMDFAFLKKDVEPFLINRAEANLINQQVFCQLIDKL